MIRLDDNLLTELGLAGLPKEEKAEFLKHMYETLEMRVGTRLAERMSNDQMAEFERFINGNDEQGAFHWLEGNFPDYKNVVAEEFEKLKDEIKPLAEQIVATSPSAAASTAASDDRPMSADSDSSDGGMKIPHEEDAVRMPETSSQPISPQQPAPMPAFGAGPSPSNDAEVPIGPEPVEMEEARLHPQYTPYHPPAPSQPAGPSPFSPQPGNPFGAGQPQQPYAAAPAYQQQPFGQSGPMGPMSPAAQPAYGPPGAGQPPAFGQQQSTPQSSPFGPQPTQSPYGQQPPQYGPNPGAFSQPGPGQPPQYGVPPQPPAWPPQQ